MARQGENTASPDRYQTPRRTELKGSIRRGMDWGGTTENSSAIPARNTRVTKEQRKTGRK